jgi:hypothetical protein
VSPIPAQILAASRIRPPSTERFRVHTGRLTVRPGDARYVWDRTAGRSSSILDSSSGRSSI